MNTFTLMPLKFWHGNGKKSSRITGKSVSEKQILIKVIG